MKYLITAMLGIFCFIAGLSAPFAVPVALLFTSRDATSLAWAWYDTPDEPDFIGLYEPTVQRIRDRCGWFIAAWYWFGLRNRAHGFCSLFSKEAREHWPETGSHDNGEFFFIRKRWWYFHVALGWQVYASTKYASKFEYRPRFAIKTRRLTPR